MNINPGKLNKRIKIVLRTSDGVDSEGFETEETETLIRACWAQVTNTSGKELVLGGKELAEAKKRFLIRDNGTEIHAGMVLLYAGHEYDIQYVNTYGDSREYVEIWTEWRAAV